jgi:hypothetical protein
VLVTSIGTSVLRRLPNWSFSKCGHFLFCAGIPHVAHFSISFYLRSFLEWVCSLGLLLGGLRRELLPLFFLPFLGSFFPG